MPGANALAYLLSASVTKKKSFVILMQGVNVTKPFSLSPMKKTNKLERSFLRAFSVSANFVSMSRGRNMPGTYTLTYLLSASVTKEKSFVT
jgi:hypothetical protein